MSPNHYFGRDDFGILGIYYNGDSALYQFDDDSFIDELGEWPLAPHTREFIYDYIEESSDRTILYAFDGGMENGIDEARGYISSAVEAYIELDNDEKIRMHKVSLKKLKSEQISSLKKVASAVSIGEKIVEFIMNESDIRKYESDVIDEYKSCVLNTSSKYTTKASQLKQDIRDESDWELPNCIPEEEEDCEEECVDEDEEDCEEDRDDDS
jgi:hypothetical protein